MSADKKSSLVQIAQATLDEATQAIKVSVVSDESGGGGGSTELTAVSLVRKDYTSETVTTSDYTELIASIPTAVLNVEIFDSSGEILVLAVGNVGAEVNKVYVFPGGNGRIPLKLDVGERLSIKAVSAAAATGDLLVNLYG
jgi:hypothetical protein